ncbi:MULTISPECIES: hypothetical protein [Halobacterium]|uniref:hypothetical protein n=1 Tax=Halobacterium TaxID=2239 RepID=UPI00073EA63A|nr:MULTISPECIES: hypothetical protein [Halobacterium]MCG1003530.1 acetoacetate decarboxylase family protein [Halobacterium noricense]
MRSPTRRAALAACVALLLVTAGCSGGTNTPSPTTGTWSPNVSVDQYPPGVADNGTLANSTVLADAHFAATANESVRLTTEANRSNYTSVKTYAHGDGPTPFYATIDRTENGNRIVSESYQTGEYGFVRHKVENRNTTLYRVTQNTTTPGTDGWLTDGDPFDVEYRLATQFVLGNYTVNGTVERGGRTLVELTADEPAPDADIAPTYNGTALVTPEGVVHRVEASYDYGTGDDRESVETSLSLDADAEWTGQPSWVDSLPQLSVSIVEDGRALELRNTGGATLSANTTFEAYGMESLEGWEARIFPDVTGTVTTDAPLEPGEAVYVTADENGTSFALHDDRARGEYAFAAAKLHHRGGGTVYSLVTGLEHRPE